MHDTPGLVELMGGDKAFERKLDKVFVPGLTLYRYIHMNEPEHHYPYLYNYCNAPWKTQKQVRRVMSWYYGHSERGLLGTDDCGQMSAWYVFSSLGFYPVAPGTDEYAIGSPIWETATIRLGETYNKNIFKIIALNQSPRNKYIQSATINGEPLETPFLSHSQITAGGELVFTMGPAPNREWGTRLD